MKEKWKIFLTIIIVLILLSVFIYLIVKINNNIEVNDEKIKYVIYNLSNTSYITVEDTLAIDNKIYKIEDAKEVDKIINILSNLEVLEEENKENSRYIIKLYNKGREEYATLSFYPLKIDGFAGSLTLGEKTSELSNLLTDNYSASFDNILANISDTLKNVTKIEVRNNSNNKLIKTIKSTKTIAKINDVILNAKLDENFNVNSISLKYNLVFLNKDKVVANVKYDSYLIFSINNKEYNLIKFDNEVLESIVSK